MRQTITAQTLVKNEDKYLWYTVMSVVDYVDSVMIWDTGSTDQTIQIIKELQKVRPQKIIFRNYGDIDANTYTTARQELLAQTKSDWLMVLDGDEVWWDGRIREAVEFINLHGDNYDTLVHRYVNPVGDIYHIQPLTAHRYLIDGQTGALNTRLINRHIPGLSAQKPHGQFGFYGQAGVVVQELDAARRHHFPKTAYMHLTNMHRSTRDRDDAAIPKRSLKLKYELGEKLPYDYYYPEVFFRPKPDIIPSPWQPRDDFYLARASVESPLKSVKRKYFHFNKSGY